MFDVAFIGAGPHSLATLTRLLEPNPDPAVDAVQRHVVPKHKVLSYWHKQRSCPSYRAALAQWLIQHVAVIDPSGCWMARWQQQFAALGIRHLRSTTAVHPDPLDSFALNTFAEATGRTSELLPLHHIHKTPDFAGPFAVPSTDLFNDFCQDLVHRYCLDDIVLKDQVVQLTPVFAETTADTPRPPISHWDLLLASGQQLQAKAVVLAIGSTNIPRLPEALQHLQPVAAPETHTEPCNTNDAVASRTGGAASAASPVPSSGGAYVPDDSPAVCDTQSLPGEVTVAGGVAACNQSGGSDCCSSYCDGACSNSSSSWSGSSSATTAVGVNLHGVLTAAPAAAAAAANSCRSCSSSSSSDAGSSSASSSPRSDCGSLCSWLALDHQPKEQGTDGGGDGPAMLQNTPACSSSSHSAGTAILSSTASGTDGAAAAACLDTDWHVVPGPCHWSSTVGSPSSTCDSLCSWLGCTHTAAQQQQQQQQQGQQSQGQGLTGSTTSQQQQLSAEAWLGFPDGASLLQDSSLLGPAPTKAEAADAADFADFADAADAADAAASTAFPARDRYSAEAPAAAAAAAATAACNRPHHPGHNSNSYPAGHLMHAWQLVQALNDPKLAVCLEVGLQQQQQHSSSSSSSSVTIGSSVGSGSLQGIATSSGNAVQSTTLTPSLQALAEQRGLLLPGESVLIIGGGLTSAHLAALAAAAAAATGAAQQLGTSSSTDGALPRISVVVSSQAQVALLLRGPLRLKQFDVDTEWMGRKRGLLLRSGFKQLADLQSRVQLMRRVLQGGSITPEAAAVLSELQDSGLLEVCEGCELAGVTWDWQQHCWDVTLQDGSQLQPHRIWLATGSTVSAQADPLLSSLLVQLPTQVINGLPAVQPNLEWTPGSGLYVLGAYAALQLGPGAGNLAGAKTASVMIARELGKRLSVLPGAVAVVGAAVKCGADVARSGRRGRRGPARELRAASAR